MRQHLGTSSWKTLAFIALILFVSACGSSKRGALLSNYSMGPQTVIPPFQPNSSSGYVPPVTTNNSVSVSASPGQSVPAGSTIYINATGATPSSYRFVFSSNPIGATFVGNPVGVAGVGVTSQVAGSVTIAADALNGWDTSGTITLTFTAVTASVIAYSSCNIQGPYAISGAAYPQVGGSFYFAVQNNSSSYYGASEPLKILNVWTQDSTETGRYYGSWDKFWMTFNSSGTKTIFVRAQSLTTGIPCEAQLTLSVASSAVAPAPSLVPGGSCGIIPATGAGPCSQVTVYKYYFDGNQCRGIWSESSCGAQGPFQTLFACEQAVASRQCGGGVTVATPGTQTVYRMDDFGLVNNNMATWGSMAHYYTQTPSEVGNFFKNPTAAFQTYVSSAGPGCDAQLYKCGYFRPQGDARQFLSLDPGCNGHFRNGAAQNPSTGFVCTYQKTGTVPLYAWYRASSEGTLYSREASSQTLTALGYVRRTSPIAYVPGN